MIYAENILICIAVPLMLATLFVRGSVRRFTGSFLLGMLICLLSAYISGFLQAAFELGEKAQIYIAPIVEEIMKFLPLLLYLLMFIPEEDAFFLAAIGLGTGFAIFENCCFILTFGAESLSYVLIRGLAVGVMHIVSIMMLAMGLLLIRRIKALSVPGVAGAFSLSVTFHGLYNLLVSEKGITSTIGYVLPVLTAAALWIPFKMLRNTSDITE